MNRYYKFTVALIGTVLICNLVELVKADIDDVNELKQQDWNNLFSRVFNVVSKEEILSARQVQLVLEELSSRLSSTSGSRINDQEADEVRFWLGIATVTADNCNGSYDRNLLTRYERRALIALPERLEESNNVWNLKTFVTSVRKTQLYFCLGQTGMPLIREIELLPVVSMKTLVQFSGPKSSPYDIAYYLAQFYKRPKWIKLSDDSKDQVKFDEVYKTEILEHCNQIKKPLDKFFDFIDYITCYDFYSKVCSTITRWYELTLVCNKLEKESEIAKVNKLMSSALKDYHKTGIKHLLGQ